MSWTKQTKARYLDAHYRYQCEMYPSVIGDGHYTGPVIQMLQKKKV